MFFLLQWVEEMSPIAASPQIKCFWFFFGKAKAAKQGMMWVSAWPERRSLPALKKKAHGAAGELAGLAQSHSTQPGAHGIVEEAESKC